MAKKGTRPTLPEQTEACAVYWLKKGRTPSEIDKERGWRDGTARAAITQRWQRDKQDKNKEE